MTRFTGDIDLPFPGALPSTFHDLSLTLISATLRPETSPIPDIVAIHAPLRPTPCRSDEALRRMIFRVPRVVRIQILPTIPTTMWL
jgi:hypothetical protein